MCLRSIGEKVPFGVPALHTGQQNLMYCGSREKFSSSRRNLQSGKDYPSWGESWATRCKTFPQHTQSIWKQQPVNKKWLFSLLGRYSQQSRSGPFLVIVWCNNTQIEVWFSRYLARHVDLMWIKDYMVEWSKYNQCNMIHSCPAEQMFEQMSGKKKMCWGVSALF